MEDIPEMKMMIDKISLQNVIVEQQVIKYIPEIERTVQKTCLENIISIMIDG